MARSSFLPVLLVAALFVVPAFVPSPAPRVSPHAAAAAGAVPLLLVAQPALAEDYMMPPSWPFVGVFILLASALLVVGNFIFPGKR
ncbi:unnamed protein product [Effrenium voratum]|nr:unnamed protein product [Effrenium voratum]|eukprot:CAMPEP_0181435500 /NCGR_PEP_ID=MMETSP1110-20121109/20365_1 /TAXON_ID=174948 /ORGANISM="Symbiodinium sp., Strain CCMP421" /LENGTH=85 /DNA_ID=CAMNT_0023559037 /DNA_START=40 /DNA_END=297 /DNA_ORIENTATION=+